MTTRRLLLLIVTLATALPAMAGGRAAWPAPGDGARGADRPTHHAPTRHRRGD